MVEKHMLTITKHCKRTTLILFVFCSIALNPSTFLAAQQTPTVRTDISPKSGSVSDLYLFTVTIDGAQEKSTPQLKAGGDFNVQLIGPKTAVSIINGEIHTQQSYIYQLTPKREGSLHTPEVEVSVDGQVLSGPSLSVLISGGAQAGQVAPPGDDLFLHQTANPQDVYQGQQIVNTIGIYASVNVEGVSIDDAVADGFWQEVISDNNSSRKVIKGKEYASLELSRALFPLRAGELVISRRKANAKVPVYRRGRGGSLLDPFSDDFFNNFFQPTQMKEVPLQSNEIKISVKALPPIPKELAKSSPGLTIVGPTALSVDYSGNVIKAGESKSISLKVSSEGNLNPLKSIPLTAAGSDLKLYEGQPQVKHKISGGRLVTEKTFTYTAIPLHGGTFRIPAVSLAYFDPTTATFKALTTSDIAFVVEGAPGQRSEEQLPSSATSSPAAGNSPQSNNPALLPTLPPVPIGPQLTYKEKTVWESISERISIQLSLLILAATIALVAIATLAAMGRRAQRPRRDLSNQLNKVRDITELELYIREWLAGRFPEAQSTATWDERRALIRNRISDKSIALALIALIDEVELNRYGGTGGASIDDLKERLSQIIKSA